jgi:VCBS repeat-containing protein
MAYLYTIDERYNGGILQFAAGALDAPDTTFTTATLAQGVSGYGATIPYLFQADRDTYSLGILDPGRYLISASGYNWDFSNSIFGIYTPTVEVYGGLGQFIGSSLFGSYTLDVAQAGSYFVTVVGQSYASNEYSVGYTRLNTPPSGIAIVSGSPIVGKTVSADYSIVDANGIAQAAIVTQWYESTDQISWSAIEGATSENLRISAEQQDKYLGYQLSYYDNDGFFNFFDSTPSTKVEADTTGPRLIFSTLDDVTINPEIIAVLTFDENIFAAGGFVKISDDSGQVLFNLSTADSDRIYVLDSRVFINFLDLLEYDQAYKIEFPAALFSDAYGNDIPKKITKEIVTTKAPGNAMAADQLGPISDDNLLNALTHGYLWELDEQRIINWSLSDGFEGQYWTDRPSTIVYVGAALETIAHYIDVEFNYVGYFSDPLEAYEYGSNINVSMSDLGGFFTSASTWARGYFPSVDYDSLKYQGASGDVYLNLSSEANYLSSYAPGSAGWFLMLHEFGHVLGLKHPHDSGGTGRPTFTDLGIGTWDIDIASVMSYQDDANWNDIAWDPASPMPLDVYGLQALYGENLTSTADDRTYKLSETESYITIWDSAGTDAIDLEDVAGGWFLTLPREFVIADTSLSLGFAFPNDEKELAAPHTFFWLMGEFETINGSNGPDTLIGNELSNVLRGGGGDDTFYGSSGDDLIFGGGDSDKVVYSHRAAEVLLTRTAVVDTYRVDLPDGSRQILTDIEFIQFSDGAELAIDVSAVNDAPVGTAVSITTDENTAKTGTLAGTDVDGDALTFAKVSDPSHGIVTIETDGSYTYTPSDNYNGTDSFTFKVNDGTVDSASATVSITVSAVNDAPVGTAVSITTDEDTVKTGTLAGTDVEGDALTFGKVSNPSHGTVTIASDGSYTYTPTANYNGTDSFTFKVNDGTVDSVDATVSITVSAVNDLPTGRVSFTGIPRQGETLVATNTLADADGMGEIGYQWYADDVPLSGAVSQEYTPTVTDVGKVITVSAIYLDGGSTLETVFQNNTIIPSYDFYQQGNWISGHAFWDQGARYTKDNFALVMQTAQIDLNLDGLLDFFAYDSYPLDVETPNPPPSIFVNDGQRLNKVTWNGPVLGNPHGVKILGGDFNGDRIADLFSLVAVDPPFGAFPNLQDYNNLLLMGESPSLVEFTDWRGFWYAGTSGDIDNDGDLDIIMFNFHVGANGVKNQILWNDGEANFTTTSDGIGSFQVDQAELVDVDHDGNLDLVVDLIDGSTRRLQVFWGDGSGYGERIGFVKEIPIDLFVTNLLSADINDDNFNEILLSGVDSQGNYQVRAYQSSDQGETVADVTANLISNPTTNIRFDHIRLYDIDGNGRLDLFATDMHSNVRWEWDGTQFARVTEKITQEPIYQSPNTLPVAIGALPLVIERNPIDGEVNVSTKTNLLVTFSEDIQLGAGEIVLKTAAGTTVETYTLGSNNVTIDGDTLTIDPSSDLIDGREYEVIFASGSVEDLSGNQYSGSSDYNFVVGQTQNYDSLAFAKSEALDTRDYRAYGEVTLSGVKSPVSGIVFDQEVSTTLFRGNFAYVKTYSETEIQVVDGVENRSTSSFTNYYDTSYVLLASLVGDYITLVEQVDDSFYNSDTFTVGDSGIVANWSTYSITDIGDLTADFLVPSEAIDSGYVSYAITQREYGGEILDTVVVGYVTDGDEAVPEREILLAPDGSIESRRGTNTGQDYLATYTLTAASDLEVIAPTVTVLSPQDGAIDFSPSGDIVVTFSEDISRSNGDIILKTAAGATVATYSYVSPEVSVSGDTLTINPSSNLSYDTEYVVEFESGAVIDLAGNANVGITDYNFTVAPKTFNILELFKTRTLLQGTSEIVGWVEIENRQVQVFGSLQLGSLQLDSFNGNEAYSQFAIVDIDFDVNGTTYSSASQDKYYFDSNFLPIADVADDQLTVYAPLYGTFGDLIAVGSPVVVANYEERNLPVGIDLSTAFDLDAFELTSTGKVQIDVQEDTVSGYRFNITLIHSNGDTSVAVFSLSESGELGALSEQGDTDSSSIEIEYQPRIDQLSPGLLTHSSDVSLDSVSVDGEIELLLNEFITRGQGDILIRDETNAVVARLASESNSISIEGNVARLDLSGLVNFSQTYSVELEADAFVDQSGNGSLAVDNLHFSTSEFIADRRVTEGRTSKFDLPSWSFSLLNADTLTYEAYLESGEDLPEWINFDSTAKSFTFDPPTDLVAESPETVRLKLVATDGVKSIRDTFGVTIKPFGSGYDINATARYWNKPASQNEYAKLAGVRLALGSESDTSTASGVMALSSVEDTYGEDDGQLILSPTLDKLASKSAADISLSDVIASLKLFLGLDLPQAYRSPYNYVAADLDANGKVELGDVISLLKVFLGLRVPDTKAMEWVFVDAAVGAINNPFNLSKNNASAPPIEHDFSADGNVDLAVDLVGIIRGDVDGSWTPPSTT